MRYGVMGLAVAIICMAGVSGAKQIDEQTVAAIENDAAIMIKGCLDVLNGTTGSDAGEPILLEDFTRQVTCPGGQVHFAYQYSGQNQMPPLHGFDFYAETDVVLRPGEVRPAKPLGEDYIVQGSLSDETKARVLEVFWDFCRHKDCFEVPRFQTADFAFYKDGRVRIEERSIFGLCGLYAIDEDTCLVTFDERAGFEFLRPSPKSVLKHMEDYEVRKRPLPPGGGQHLLLQPAGAGWLPYCLVDYEAGTIVRQPAPADEEAADCVARMAGKMSERKAQDLLEACAGFLGGAIDNIRADGSWALVSSDAYRKRPLSGVLLSRESARWKVKRHYSLVGMDVRGWYWQYLPLPEKPSAEMVKAFVTHVRRPDGVTLEDLKNVCELAARVPNVDHRITGMRCVNEREIQVTTGDMSHPLAGSGSTIVFRKSGGLWRAVEVNQWIS